MNPKTIDHQPIGDQPIDPQLLSKLQALRAAPAQRDPVAAARSQARFLNELDQTFAGRESIGPQAARLGGLGAWLGFRTPRRRALASLGLTLAVLALVWSGTSAAARAAQVALPGDALYPLKTGLEQARISVNSRDAQSQVELYLEIAEHRLEEMEGLAEMGQSDQIAGLAQQFQGTVAQAQAVAASLSQSDPAAGAALSAQIEHSLAEFAHQLNEIAAQLPASALGSLQPALDAAHATLTTGSGGEGGSSEESPASGGEDNGNDNANFNGAGGEDDGNGNGNANLNDNGDDKGGNDNANINENGDDKGNDNANLNDNGDDKGGNDNANLNDSGDDKGGNDNANLNESGDDKGNDSSGGDKGGGDNANDSGGGGSHDGNENGH